MKYKLINEIDESYSTKENVLLNRGIPKHNIDHFMEGLSRDDLIDPTNLDNIDKAAQCFLSHMQQKSATLLIVDCDADGFCSSAELLNWIYDVKPDYAEEIDLFIHEGKQHGIELDKIDINKYKLILIPDASSENYEEHKTLAAAGVDIIVLDHHEADHYSDYAIVINNQLSANYSNKSLCGGGVVYKFLTYLEQNYTKTAFAENYIDLVALSLISDMMDSRVNETQYLIQEGLKHIKNPYFYYMVQKNSFSLGNELTPIGIAFYVTPFINAFVRSGTMEEKKLLFDAMLKFKAFKKVPSTKRGHKIGEMETVVEQAVRVSTNVKNRQTKVQDQNQLLLEQQIKDNNLLDNKVILLQVAPGQIDRNIAGLVANRIMAKYQRPTCILTQVTDENGISYQGSARGCDKVDVREFKDICEQTGVVEFVAGHQGAFGLGIKKENVFSFIEATNKTLKDMPAEPIYYVDYIFKGQNVNGQVILDIADMKKFYGKDIDEPYIAIEGLKVTSSMLTLMSPDKKPTLKISLNNGVSIIKFKSSEEEYMELSNEGYVEINLVGRCNKNEWLGNITPQIIVEEYEVVGKQKYYF